MTAQESKLQEFTADLLSESGRKYCFRIARQMAREGRDCLVLEEEVAAAIKELKIGKAASPTGVVSEMMKAAGGFASRWMTDLINNIVKEGCIPDDWRKSILVPVYKGKGDPLVYGSYRAIKLLEQPMKVLERVLEKRIRC